MAIEFRCSQCGRLLRVGDETAGKQAQCPECGTVSTVPASAAAAAAPAAASASPFGPGGPYQSPQSPTGYGGPTIQTGPRMSYVPNYLVQAILCTLFCCMPFGVVAIVFAAQVNGKLAAGDYHGAMSASNSARTWCWVSFWLGLIPILLYFVFIVIMAAGGAMH